MSSSLLKSLILNKALRFKKKEHNMNEKKKRNKKGIANRVKSEYDFSIFLCRVCNEPKGSVSVFESTGMGEATIADEIKIFSGVEIFENDQYAKFICNKCLSLLNKCVKFRAKCQETDKLIKREFLRAETYPSDGIDTDGVTDLALKVEADEDCTGAAAEAGTAAGGGSDDDYLPSPSFSEDYSRTFHCTCLQNFTDRASLKQHQRACEVDRQQHKYTTKQLLLCDICGQTANSKASLISHIGTHGASAFPYKCDQCPYRGRTAPLLKIHKRTHMADKPYKCASCPLATTTASNLKKHVSHVHGTSKNHKCKYCEKLFAYGHDMKRHIQEIHFRQDVSSCDICHKTFTTRKILRGHKLKVHKVAVPALRGGRLPAYMLCAPPAAAAADRAADDIKEQVDKSMRLGRMPLTAKEKTRRYRERLKRERPEEFEAQRKRNLARILAKQKERSKKASAYSDEEDNKPVAQFINST